MTVGIDLPEPVILISGIAVIVACGFAGIVAILGLDPLAERTRRRRISLLEHEKDVAAALGWRWRNWIALRAGITLAGVLIGITS